MSDEPKVLHEWVGLSLRDRQVGSFYGGLGMRERVNGHWSEWTQADPNAREIARLAAEVKAKDERIEELEEAARDLVAKLDECKPHVDAAFVMSCVHGGSYSGPEYKTAQEAMRAALEGK